MNHSFPRNDALAVSRAMYNLLKSACVRLKVAGSLRRGKAKVSDIEFVYIPRLEDYDTDLFGEVKERRNLMDIMLTQLLIERVLDKRRTEDGKTIWGEKNKFAVHRDSGIPIDFFATDELCWWNTLVLRTGGKLTNLKITTAANRKGYSFEAYGSGFRSLAEPANKEARYVMQSEEDIFKFVGLPYLAPERRE